MISADLVNILANLKNCKDEIFMITNFLNLQENINSNLSLQNYISIIDEKLEKQVILDQFWDHALTVFQNIVQPIQNCTRILQVFKYDKQIIDCNLLKIFENNDFTPLTSYFSQHNYLQNGINSRNYKSILKDENPSGFLYSGLIFDSKNTKYYYVIYQDFEYRIFNNLKESILNNKDNLIYTKFQNCSINGTSLSTLFDENLSSLIKLQFGKNVSIVGNASKGFSNLTNLIQLNIQEPKYFLSGTTDINSLFSGCKKLYKVPEIYSDSVSSSFGLFKDCSNLIYVNDISLSATENVASMFQNCTKLVQVPNLIFNSCTNFDNMFRGCNVIKYIQDVGSNINVSANGIFSGCINLKSIQNFNFLSGVSLNKSFYNCNNLKQLTFSKDAIPTNFDNTFQNCYSLNNIENIKIPENIKLDNTFSGCISLTNLSFSPNTKISSTFDISKSVRLTKQSVNDFCDKCASDVNNLSAILGDKNSLKLYRSTNNNLIKKGWIICPQSQNLLYENEFDINNIIIPSSLLDSKIIIQKLEIPDNVSFINAACDSFYPLESDNTSDTEYMSAIIEDEIKITQKNISGYKMLVNTFTTQQNKLYYSSYLIHALKNIDDLSSFVFNDYAKYALFKNFDMSGNIKLGPSNLNYFYIEDQNSISSYISKNIDEKFKDCSGLIMMPKQFKEELNKQQPSSACSAFMNCVSLKDVSDDNLFNLSSLQKTDYMFAGCTSLQNVINISCPIEENTFINCTNLKTLIFNKKLSSGLNLKGCDTLNNLTSGDIFISGDTTKYLTFSQKKFDYANLYAEKNIDNLSTNNWIVKTEPLHSIYGDISSNLYCKTKIEKNISVYISSSILANYIDINSGGSLTVSSGGIANSTTINQNGSLYVSSGGTALNVDWQPFRGDIIIQNGGYITYNPYPSGVYLGSGQSRTSSASTMNNITISNGQDIYVMNSGIVSDIKIFGYKETTTFPIIQIISSYGGLKIYSGGIVNNTSVNLYGSLTIFSGGIANSTTVCDSGHLYVSSGGIVSGITVNNNGYLYVYSGGTALNVDWQLFRGYIIVSSGGSITYNSQPSGVYYARSNTFLLKSSSMDNKTLSSDYEMIIINGGMANSTIISGGHLYISSGGIANDTTVNDGYLYIFSGATANNTTVNTYGYLCLHVAPNTYANGSCWRFNFTLSGGVINNFTINRGYLHVHSGGIANYITVNKDGLLYVSSGGTVNQATIFDGQLYLNVAPNTYANGTYYGTNFTLSNGIINNFTISSGGHLYISSGGMANSTIISGGYLQVFSGGKALNVDWKPVSGHVAVYEGGYITYKVQPSGVYLGKDQTLISSALTMDNITIDDYQSMYIMNSGIVNSIIIDYRGDLYVYSGGIISGITVYNNGALHVYSGGTALNITSNPGAIISSYDGATIEYKK